MDSADALPALAITGKFTGPKLLGGATGVRIAGAARLS